MLHFELTSDDSHTIIASNNNIADTSKSESLQQHSRVERSASPILNELSSKSTYDDNNAKFGHLESNDVEASNGRYFNLIQPTSSSKDRSAEHGEITKSERMAKDLSMDSFLLKRGPRLDTSGSPISPTHVSPMTLPIATQSNHPRQNPNPDIQDIITGIVKLLNGNVNVHANTQPQQQQQPSRRPYTTRINNRGPPRISEAQPLPNDFDQPPQQVPTSTMRPPPYPFDRPDNPVRPFINGVPLPEQIVPSMQQNYRPGFISQNRPPWQRPRPRPPITGGNRRPPPPPPLQYKPIPTMPEYHPEDDVQLTTVEIDTNSTDPLLLESNGYEVEEDHTDDIESSSVEQIVAPSTKVPSKKEDFSKKKDKNKMTDKSEKKPIIPVTPTSTVHQPSFTTIIQSTSEINTSQHIASTSIAENIPETTLTSFIIESSIADNSYSSSSIITEHTPILISTSEKLDTPKHTIQEYTQITTTSTQLPSSPHPLPAFDSSFPYHPRPGIVLDDPEFKPGGANRQPTRQRPQIQPTKQVTPPGYGEIFDVTLSAIQGPSGSGSKQTIKIKPYGENYGGTGSGDIIVSPSGEDGFVSIDGKRTYLNLFGDSSETSTIISSTHRITPSAVASSSSASAVRSTQSVSFRNILTLRMMIF